MSNSKEACSTHVSKKQVVNVVDASAFAYWQGAPFTRAVNFSFEGYEDRPQQFLSRWFKLSGEWLRRKNAPRANIYALECPPTKFLNAHCLIHVPNHLMAAFARKERRWMKEAGWPWKEGRGRLQSEMICDEANKKRGPQSPGELLVNIEGAIAYLLKGAEPDVCEVLKIDHQWQGEVEGKRCGVSQSISKAARDRGGYVPPLNTRGSLIFRWRCKLSEPLLMAEPAQRIGK